MARRTALQLSDWMTAISCMQDAVIRAFTAPDTGEAPLLDPPEQAQVPAFTSQEPEGHCSAVQSLAICGSYVCSAGGDAMIRVWRANDLAFVG